MWHPLKLAFSSLHIPVKTTSTATEFSNMQHTIVFKLPRNKQMSQCNIFGTRI